MRNLSRLGRAINHFKVIEFSNTVTRSSLNDRLATWKLKSSNSNYHDKKQPTENPSPQMSSKSNLKIKIDGTEKL